MNENPRLDKETYESSRVYLKAALEHMLEAGRSVRELSEFAMEKFGNDFLPYLQQFKRDVSHGRITVNGLTRPARTKLLGHHVTPEERENLIREAAYLIAEQRGFTGGSADQDWILAEHQVDMQLAREAGLVVKGSKALASVTAVVEQDLANSKRVVMRWLDRKFPASSTVKKATRKKKPAARAVQASKGSRQAANRTGQASGAGKKATKKKTSVKKTTTAGKKAPATKKKTATTKKKATAGKRQASATTGGKAAKKKQSTTRKPARKQGRGGKR